MAWPKGVPRKKKEVAVSNEEPVVVSAASLSSEGVVVSQANSVEEMSISVMPGVIPTLANAQSDPFSKFKTEPDKFAYRAINTRPHLRREREAQGWQPIAGAEYGDLILAKIPKSVDTAIKQGVADKTRKQTEATTQGFKEDAARSGVKTFNET